MESAVVPGNASESALVERVSDPGDSRMPPPDSGKAALTPDEIRLLRKWIDNGAGYQKHWSFRPVNKPSTPSPTAGESVIDAFVSRRLFEEGLRLSEPADRHTLIRRVSFDLTGLPPSRAEIGDFLSDDSPDAYERLIDRLLASPRYGEHMARYWLDAARYGDTHGLHLDNYREIWPYRDWVIASFNSNQPFDQFLIEQIAGDLLGKPAESQLIATGFLRCNVTTNEGGSIVEEVFARNVMDRVDTYGVVMLGMTFGCAKCHDHKYDPVTMEDYYSLFAFFNNIDGKPMDKNVKDHAPVLKLPDSVAAERVAQLDQLLEHLKAKHEAAAVASPGEPGRDAASSSGSGQ